MKRTQARSVASCNSVAGMRTRWAGRTTPGLFDRSFAGGLGERWRLLIVGSNDFEPEVQKAFGPG